MHMNPHLTDSVAIKAEGHFIARPGPVASQMNDCYIQAYIHVHEPPAIYIAKGKMHVLRNKVV